MTESIAAIARTLLIQLTVPQNDILFAGGVFALPFFTDLVPQVLLSGGASSEPFNVSSPHPVADFQAPTPVNGQ